MRTFKFCLTAATALGLFGMVANAEIAMAQSGAFTAEDAYAQMGGMPFQMAELAVTVAQLP